MAGQDLEQTKFVRQLNFWARDASNESAMLQASWVLGLFDALGDAGKVGLSIEQAAAKIHSDVRGTKSLLEPLAGLGFCTLVDQGRYALDPALQHALLDERLQALLAEVRAVWHPLRALSQAVRAGGPVQVNGKSWDLLGLYQKLFLKGPLALHEDAQDFFDRFARNVLRCHALITAGELKLLAALTEGAHPIEPLAARLGVSAQGLSVLIDVLGTMEIVTRDGGQVRYGERAAKALDGQSLPYFERALPATVVYWEGMGRLDEAVRDRTFVLDLKKPEMAKQVYEENASRISGIFASHIRLGKSAAEVIKKVRSLEGAHVLDVGTGSGVWGAAFAKSEPTLRVTFLDSEHVLATCRENISGLGLADRATFLAGDCVTTDYGTGTFDVVLLPQIIPVIHPHERKILFERVSRALKPRGLLAVSGYVLNDQRTGPMDALYFSLRRYMSNEGDVLAMPDFRRELGEVGFRNMRRYDLPIQQLVLASKGDVELPEPKVAAPAQEGA